MILLMVGLIALDTIDINGNDIKVWTGGSTGFDKLVTQIAPAQLVTNRPYIEVVCIDPTNYVFEADILR